MIPCLVCGEPMPAVRTHNRPSRACSPTCAGELGARVTKRRDYYIEEIEHMTSLGISPNEIAQRLGIKPASMARSMHRAERPDLAHLFASIAIRDRMKPCAEGCGAMVNHKAARCHRCAMLKRRAS